MKRRIAIVLFFSMLLCGCGEKKDETNTNTVSSEKATVSTTTASSESDANTDTTTVSSAADTETPSVTATASETSNTSTSETWFSPVTYEGMIDGVTKVRYLFDDQKSGCVMDLDAGTITKFECEQGEDTVVFTFDGAYDTAVMNMSKDQSGNTVGTMDGVTYVFVDPDSTDSSSESYSDSPYVGSYHMENSQRGWMSIDQNGDTYSVYITWMDSTSTVSEWSFTGEFNGRGVLSFDNCVKKNITYSADGEPEYEQVYTNGTGYIRVSEEGTKTGITWFDDIEDAGSGVFFIKD